MLLWVLCLELLSLVGKFLLFGIKMSNVVLLSDVLTRVRNGQKAGHPFVVSSTSKFITSVLEVIKSGGYIKGYEEFEERKGVKRVKIDLRYYKGLPVIQEMSMVSKPGRRVYSSIESLGKIYGGLGIFVLSTSKGVISDVEARSLKVGGEVLCQVF